ncbi:thiol methyltransferas-like protein [Dothidotthia symphoricarpi CBS 119687]|uniref:Thiol methyltransferas-like protein n=1 Tax=Dothidotthia symphoricarpi CBS 119687 TaxID=1392245 RepID=A0A6A6ABK1_9PLEO|nr:thiol methyltransferas-like protein [Dothidotthia symphoricarpi CBS 119687]KAF2128535.1 thiol methyltransferas-like protein [Dothidotthia symphoricarpi CBS 119687]
MTTEARSVENRTRLVSHFVDFRTREEQSAGWTSLWESNESNLWDRGQPSPAFVDFLDTHAYGKSLVNGGHQLKALVPGCGRGHDVAMLALHGFESYGLEVSPTAVETANEHVKFQLAKPAPHNFGETVNRPTPANARVILGDFFQQDWKGELGADFGGFDLIYDYTFLCALLPEMRKDWVRRMADLLSPTGVLVCLEFPMWKPLKAQGPPWGLNGVHLNLAEGGDGVADEEGRLRPTDGKGGLLERVEYWKPPKSFEQSRGEDMISVWKVK